MIKYEKEDYQKYKKLTFNNGGIKEFAFDSYGNPITMRNEKPKSIDKEIVKPDFKIGKKFVSNTINSYYSSAFEQQRSSMRESLVLPPPIPNKGGFIDVKD